MEDTDEARLQDVLTGKNYYCLLAVMANSRQTGKRTFRELCAEHGLAATHQRQILYEVMQTMLGHPSPEEVYTRVKRRIPSISLATVYKNIHLFVEKGVLKELSMHHGSLRVEINHSLHHHLVCSQCKTITDVEERDLGFKPEFYHLPEGFQVERCSIDIIGLCAACRQTDAAYDAHA